MNHLRLPANHDEATFQLDIPLDADTDSENNVALLVGKLLNDISDVDRKVSHSDILQALAIATAVRMAMADAAEKSGVDLSMRLLELDVDPKQGVGSYAN